MRIIIMLILVLFSLQLKAQTSIYTIKLDSIAGSNQIDFAAFQGRKILIVNTASQDTAASQYIELLQLKQLYKDSLIIVVVPSNSFNTEPGTNASISGFYSQSTAYKFPVASLSAVTGTNTNPLFLWLSQASQNAVMNITMNQSFQKFLVNRQGKLVGIFNASVRPYSFYVRNAIENGY